MIIYRIVYHDENMDMCYDNGFYLRKEDAKMELNRILSTNDDWGDIYGNTCDPECALKWSIEDVVVKE